MQHSLISFTSNTLYIYAFERMKFFFCKEETWQRWHLSHSQFFGGYLAKYLWDIPAHLLGQYHMWKSYYNQKTVSRWEEGLEVTNEMYREHRLKLCNRWKLWQNFGGNGVDRWKKVKRKRNEQEIQSTRAKMGTEKPIREFWKKRWNRWQTASIVKWTD